MNTKVIGVIVTFSALTIILSQIRIPLPFPPPGFSYQLYQIPIVIAFLLIGPKYGFIVALLNMLVNMLIPTGPLGVLGPPFMFLVTLSLLLGIYVASKISEFRGFNNDKNIGWKKITIFSLVATGFRAIFVLPVDFFVFGYFLSMALGMTVSDAFAYAYGIMGGIVIFNLIVAIYVSVVSYFVFIKIRPVFEKYIF
ncbi:MAG: hypothetical protein P8X87_07435 [Candidatus Bathyarchaeota archaeon]